MTRNPGVVDITATVQDAADVIFAAEVRHVPVVEQGELVGMVSDRELPAAMCSRAPSESSGLTMHEPASTPMSVW
jgi:CBS domain-containing protein